MNTGSNLAFQSSLLVGGATYSLFNAHQQAMANVRAGRERRAAEARDYQKEYEDWYDSTLENTKNNYFKHRDAIVLSTKYALEARDRNKELGVIILRYADKIKNNVKLKKQALELIKEINDDGNRLERTQKLLKLGCANPKWCNLLKDPLDCAKHNIRLLKDMARATTEYSDFENKLRIEINRMMIRVKNTAD